VYRGIDNKLEIDVPLAKSFKVTAPGLKQSGKPWEYAWYVTDIKTNAATLDFEIVTKNDSVFRLRKEFYVLDFPKMIATLNNNGCNNCIVELAKDNVAAAIIGVCLENYNDRKFPYFYVKEYTLILPEGHRYTVYQDKFSESAQKMILQYPAGTIFKITDILYNSPSYSPPKVELKFMLVDEY
jgi:hypothetical protein